MTNGFKPVVVGVAQEGGIVGFMIVAQPRRTIVTAASGNACTPERVDLNPCLRLETPVASVGVVWVRSLSNGKINPVRVIRSCAFAIAKPIITPAHLQNAKRGHDRIVKFLSRCY